MSRSDQSTELWSVVEAALAGDSGRPVRILAAAPVAGGSIHAAYLLDLSDGSRRFLKCNPSVPAEMFAREAEGLEVLGRPGILRVPRQTLAAPDGDFLLMEAIETGLPGAGFFASFGRRLAELHRATRSPRFGFDHDNYIGATPQANGWCDDWCEFWRRRRLQPQLELARGRGLSDRQLDRLGDRLAERLGEWLGLADEPACLLHGDLWGGNYLVAAGGEPVLVDPAVYYGQREAELAMTELFGGFPAEFRRAYEEAWPLPPGSPERIAIYKLYHLLNHLNLFGRGYRDGCVQILSQLV